MPWPLRGGRGEEIEGSGWVFIRAALGFQGRSGLCTVAQLALPRRKLSDGRRRLGVTSCFDLPLHLLGRCLGWRVSDRHNARAAVDHSWFLSPVLLLAAAILLGVLLKMLATLKEPWNNSGGGRIKFKLWHNYTSTPLN
jgi:hypothetical protein